MVGTRQKTRVSSPKEKSRKCQRFCEIVSDKIHVIEPPARGEAAQSALAGVRGRSPRENFEVFYNRNLEIAFE